MKKQDKLKYYKFLNSLPKKINKLYFKKLNGNFEIINKSKKKGGFDPVTKIDRLFEKYLRSEISKKFPRDGIIGEEFQTKSRKSNISWVIDPIDGTRSFIIGSPTWSNLISINYNDKPILGLVNFPILKKYYITGVNKKSYLVKNNKKKKINVAKFSTLQKLKIAAGFFSFTPKKLQKVSKLINLIKFPCSDALSYCQLCEGKLDVVIQSYNKIWDIHPMITLVRNSGGCITTWDNSDPISGGNILVCSNNKIHQKMLKFLKPIS